MSSDNSNNSGTQNRNMNLHLTPAEKQIFEFLLKVLDHFKLKTTLRVAGGWVRDKLLGKESMDLDIAVDDLTGFKFAEYVNAYFSFCGEKQHQIGVIQANPEQSKHLETAHMKIFDQEIDFVHLRTEEYTAASRIPNVKIGGPEEDAYRRDITINALFYNINQNVVEDFTNMGVSDLFGGLIRTPLPAFQTFMDDPLRVLRSVRFAARFKFTIHPDILSAASDPTIQECLHDKVSRDRIGKELSGIVNGENAFGEPDIPGVKMAFQIFHQVGLFPAIFLLPAAPPGSSYASHEECYQTFKKFMSRLEQSRFDFISKADLKTLYIASFFFPWHEQIWMNAKKKKASLVEYLIMESLKWPRKEGERISLLAKCAVEMSPLISRSDPSQPTSLPTRKEIGIALRNAGILWKQAAFLATAILLPESKWNHFQAFCNAVDKYDLDEVWELKPLINGQELCNLLKKEKGSWVASALQNQIEWQIENPHATVPECTTWILEKFS